MGVKEVKLKDLLIILRNGANIKQYEDAEGLPITRIETISDTTINLLKVGYANIFDDKYQDYYLQEGDILLSHINSVTHLGKCAIYNNPTGKLIHGMNLLMLRANKEFVLPRYLYYVLNSKQFKIQLPKITKKSVNQASITVTDIGNLNLIIEDDINQQQKIVDILDKADEIRQKKKLANDKLDEFLKSTFIDMFGNPKINSKQLQMVKIKDLCTVQTGSTPKRDVESYYKDATIPWVKTGEVINQYIYNSEEFISERAIKETNCKLFPINTILVAMYGQGLTRGRVGMLKIEASTNQACSAILPSNKINQEFLYNQLKMQYQTLRDYGRGGNQPNLNMDIIKNFEIVVPPIEQQNQFVQIVEKVEAQKQKNELVIEQMNNLFNSLSQKAFKGEL